MKKVVLTAMIFLLFSAMAMAAGQGDDDGAMMASDGGPVYGGTLTMYTRLNDEPASPAETDNQWIATFGKMPIQETLGRGDHDTYGPRGNVDFLAPEVATGGPATAQSDIWSLGLTIHATLTRHSIRPPAPAGTVLDRLRHNLSNPPQFDPRLPGALTAILSTCVRPDPTDRYTSAAALADDLDSTLDDQEIAEWQCR